MKNASDSLLRKIAARTLALLLILSLGASVADELIPHYQDWSDEQLIAVLDELMAEADARGIIYTPPSGDRLADFDVYDVGEDTPRVGVQPVAGGGVWVPINGGSKYHCKPDCSGMVDPVETSEESALSCGFGPCRRCYKYK